MNEFWEIVSGWSGPGQGIFLLIVIGGVLGLISRLMYYLTVLLHGWPPPDTPMPDEEDE